ncbi:MAG: hypothetical protein MK081_12350 [Flavobacteriales bacterium]|nr:hypothetical protein [Flavobacteriales bacterium]
MLMPGRSFAQEDYRYGFNGQEQDNEIAGEGNSYDFGARMYDPRIARWSKMDNLWKKYPSESPYDYSMNNPILFIDQDGNEVFAYTNESKELLLKVVSYAFGVDHGFEFVGDKLVHDGSAPENWTDSQQLMFTYFNEVLIKSDIEVSFIANVDGYIDPYGITGQITHDKTNKHGGRTLYQPTRYPLDAELQGEETDGVQLMKPLPVPIRWKRVVSMISSDATREGSRLSIFGYEDKGEGMIPMRNPLLTKWFSPGHVGLHELGHAIVQIIKYEMGGEFNGVDFNAMTSEEQSDWSIRWTNTVLKDKGETLESGAGQHGRSATEYKSKSELKPIEQ